MSAEDDAKKMLRDVFAAAVDKATSLGIAIEALRGTAFFNDSKDSVVKSLDAFPNATAAVSRLPLLSDWYGDAADRIVLQFIYTCFERSVTLSFDEAAFGATWDAFAQELAAPEWISRGIANLTSFASDQERVELGDGIEIRGRRLDELGRLGFDSYILQRIEQDWHRAGASPFVLVAERRIPKSANNLLDVEPWQMYVNAQRAIGALRLLAAGDVRMGVMWVTRVAAFNFGLGGYTYQGASISAGGTRYTLSHDVRAGFGDVYSELRTLEGSGYGRAPGNLALALRSFMATYDRWPVLPDSQLLDAITALEATLGSGTEITFKLAFRVAALLADNDDDRSSLFDGMKAFYDTRSALVHGGSLKAKHQERLNRVDEARAIVRRLLRALVRFAVDGHSTYTKKFFMEDLDTTLLHAPKREALRTALGLART